MSKPIPVKKKHVAKKKSKSKSEIPVKKKLALPKDARIELERLEANADRRYEWALPMKKLQPEDVVVALNRMTDVMGRMSAPPMFTFNGVNYTEVVGEARLRSIRYKNHIYAAIKMLVACAEWGIRIGNFKAPKHECIRCGKSVKPKKKMKKKVKS